MNSKEELFNKNVKNLPDELIYIIKGFVGSYYPFIEEVELTGMKWLYNSLINGGSREISYIEKHKENKLVTELNSFKLKPRWNPMGYHTWNKIKNKENKKTIIELLKINKVKGRTKLIKNDDRNEMINALIKI